MATDERERRGTAPLTIACVNPLDHTDEIKQLFLAHERPEFPAYFDRAYPDAVAEGACAWVGTNEGGRTCAYVAQFPRRFWWGRHLVRGALVGNLMVSKAYRRFWPALALMRRVVQDLQQSGSCDFVYGDPNEIACPVGQGAGLVPVASLQRFVLPLADRRRAVALCIRAYRLLGRFKTGVTRLALTEQPADLPEDADLRPSEDPRSLRPIRHAALYKCRLAGYPREADRWCVFHAGGPRGVPAGRALVRGPDDRGVALVCAWQCEPLTRLSSILVALGNRLAELGAARLELYVMTGSHAEREVRRSGFLPREERIAVMALPVTPLGSEVVAAATEWRILPVDLDR